MNDVVSLREWAAPTECDLCPHPIVDHTLWEPDAIENGWMICAAAECDECWHEWPRLTEPV